MGDLFEEQNKVRTQEYVREMSKSFTELKDRVITPEKPVPAKGFEEDEGKFHGIVTKDLALSRLENNEDVEIGRIYGMAINMARMLDFHLLAAFLTDELNIMLGLKKSVTGWQQDKLNELRGTYDVKSNVSDAVKKAGGV